MIQQKLTSKAFFRTLTVIHAALMMGIVSFTTVVLLIRNDNQVSSGFDENSMLIFIVISAILTLLGGIGNKIAYTTFVKGAQKKETLSAKMQAWQVACIIRMALLEGSALFTVVIFLLSGQYYFLIFTLILLALMLTVKPSKQKAIDDLQLNSIEMQTINNDESILIEP